MGGKKGNSEIYGEPTTVEGVDYYNRYPDVAESGLNPYYHYEVHGKKEGRTWGLPQEEQGFSFAMPEFKMPATPDYAGMQKEAQAEAERKAALANIDALYRNKFSAANQASDKVNTQLAEEMGYAKVAGADYSYTEAQKKERINNMFASLWSEGDESRLAALESQYGSGGNRWTSGIVRGVAKTEGALDEDGASAGSAVDPSKVLTKVLGSDVGDDEEDKLGGVLGKLGGS